MSRQEPSDNNAHDGKCHAGKTVQILPFPAFFANEIMSISRRKRPHQKRRFSGVAFANNYKYMPQWKKSPPKGE
jgi:hypothetical protein